MKVSFRVHLLFLLIILANLSYSRTFYIKSVAEYNAILLSSSAGDTVIWKKGVYENQLWKIKKNGIKIFAEIPGEVIFKGSSSVKISGDMITFSGFQFLDGFVTGHVIEVSGSNNLVSHVNISNYQSHYYLQIETTGRNNVIEYCNFEKKPLAQAGVSPQSILQVEVDEKEPGNNIIRYCSFKNHTAPEDAGGDYGMEALRIGYSFQHTFISRTIVEYCYFKKCNGDGEIISNKARQNVFRYNTFYDNGKAQFTLRRGSENIIYGNFFFNGGGIRLKEGGNQLIFNNYFETGDWFALKFENFNGNPRLDNVLVAHNTFINSGKIELGGTGDFIPLNISFSNNIFSHSTSVVFADPTGTENYLSNIFDQKLGIRIQDGLQKVTSPGLEKNTLGYYQLVKGSPSIDKSSPVLSKITNYPGLDYDKDIRLDIMGNNRPVAEKLKDIGCTEYSGTKEVNPYATEDNTGPSYFQNKNSAVSKIITEQNIRSDSVALENGYVKIFHNRAYFSKANNPNIGTRVIVALADLEIKSSKGKIKISRGGVAAFLKNESYDIQSGEFFEVGFKENHPPLKQPEQWLEPIKNTIVYEDNQIRVFEERLEPGDTRELHSHNQRVVVRLNEVKLTDPRFHENGTPGGGIQVPNTVRFAEPMVHVVRNLSKIPLFNVVIEYKTAQN